MASAERASPSAPWLDPRYAAALGLSSDADDEAIARRMATLAGLATPLSKERGRLLAELAKVAQYYLITYGPTMPLWPPPSMEYARAPISDAPGAALRFITNFAVLRLDPHTCEVAVREDPSLPEWAGLLIMEQIMPRLEQAGLLHIIGGPSRGR